ncbi:DUF1819 family protein [[Eubacterium] rectale]|uniref:DUF1819 family protein n=1 Tax=Agathobacter rectalis TaxID=39491 RepID=A0AAW4UB20_9FIRM|nr:DUF1819 family protein [Agathobacter rectalis]MCB6936986.1 DUF1819 family protein [Agathobacter rectalis]MCB6967813.1 DUF1819 family protein [Agathobacter rectalis]
MSHRKAAASRLITLVVHTSIAKRCLFYLTTTKRTDNILYDFVLHIVKVKCYDGVHFLTALCDRLFL